MHSIKKTRSFLGQLIGLFQLARPKQWAKNGFVMAPLIFSSQFLDPAKIKLSLFAFILFCIASSATYIINDIKDVEKDRRHPKKALKRPLASGATPLPFALALLGLLYLCLIAGWFILPKVILVISFYILLNLAYTFSLKHQPVLDIFCIATGFVLRVYAGAVAISVPVSSWMFITTLCLALYLASIKRRQELLQSGQEGRTVLKKYSVALVDRYAEMSATGALLFYSIFVLSAKPALALTIPLVIFGLFRYWFVVETLEGGESPTDALFNDHQLLLSVCLWIIACGWAEWPLRG